MKKNTGYAGCFLLGIIFAVDVAPKFNFIGEFIVGYEIQSMTSFPYYHRARLYTKPGFGDQTFTLEVDEETVWVSGDAAPGDLKEKLIWDETGHLLTLELSGEKVVVYDALNREIRHESR